MVDFPSAITSPGYTDSTITASRTSTGLTAGGGGETGSGSSSSGGGAASAGDRVRVRVWEMGMGALMVACGGAVGVGMILL